MEEGSKILGGLSLYQFPASKIGFSESRKLRVIFLALWWQNYFSDLMFESRSLKGLKRQSFCYTARRPASWLARRPERCPSLHPVFWELIKGNAPPHRYHEYYFAGTVRCLAGKQIYLLLYTIK